MKKNPHKINLFLIFYLILYLCLSLGGPIFFGSNTTNRIGQFLPLVLGFFYLLYTRQPVLATVKIRKFRPVTIVLTVLFTYCLWPLISIINMLSMLFAQNHIDAVVNQTVTSSGFVYTLFTMALLPACLEEFTFRGIIYSQYRNDRPIKAILLSALCFGLMHMNFNQFCYAFILGIFLTLLLEASGSLILPMIMHFTFNGTSIALVYVQQKIRSALPDVYPDPGSSVTRSSILATLPSMLPIAVVGCLIAFLLYYKIASINGNWEEIRSWKDRPAYQKRENYKLTGIPFYAFVVICFLMCIMMEFIS